MTCAMSIKNWRRWRTMSGRRLILADGSRIENGEAGKINGMIWCYLPGWTIIQAAQVFTDRAKTSEIRFQYGEMQDVYTGYTNCTNIMTGDGKISVCMDKGEI